jgi:hypothetical protein
VEENQFIWSEDWLEKENLIRIELGGKLVLISENTGIVYG